LEQEGTEETEKKDLCCNLAESLIFAGILPMVFLTQRRKGPKAQSVLSCLASLRLGDFALKSLLYPWFHFFGCGVAALCSPPAPVQVFSQMGLDKN